MMTHWGLEFQVETLICKLLGKLHVANVFFSYQRIVYRWVKRHYSKMASRALSTNCVDKGKHIWVIWWQGRDKMPALVEKCIESIYRNSNGFEVCLIDKDNYSHYISIPDYILDKRAKGVISFAAFSDYIRFKLLQKYGGWYCDATIYATKRFQESPSIYTAKSIEDPRFISRGLWSSFLWYLPWGGYSFPNFIISALDDYWSKHDEIIDYFLIDNLIMIFYEMNSVFRKSIDSLVIDNPDLYFFQSQQSFSDYDDSIWQSVKSRNRFFKCNRRTVSSNKKSFHFTLLGQ